MEQTYLGRLKVHVIIPDLEEYGDEVDERDVVAVAERSVSGDPERGGR